MKKEVKGENYLLRKPERAKELSWSIDEEGKVTLEKENKGFFNRLCQKLFNKPKVSFIHLDETGSFLWPRIDGEKDLLELGRELSEEFGDKAEPLYERLADYFRILESYGFIRFK